MLFNREIKISQLADDTTLFLKDKNLIKNAIKLVQTFSDASGLQLTLWLCSGQIDPKKILFFPKILVNVIALDSNLLTLFTL